MKHKSILLLTLLLFPFFSFSQNGSYSDGYIVTVKGDTLFGKIKNLGEVASCSKIKFLNSKGESVKIKNKHVVSYKRGRDVFFRKSYDRPLVIGNMKGYMKLVKDGAVKLYRFDYVVHNAGHNFNGMMTPGTSSWSSDYYLEKNGTHILVTKMGFKNNMSNYFISNKDLAEEIKSRKMKYNDLEKIVSIYNQNKEIE